MPFQQRTARGYEEPFTVQFSIFLANRVGQLREMLDVFLGERVHIYGLSIVDSTDWAVIRVVLSDPDKAWELLKRHSLPFTESPVLLVEIPSGDALSDVCSHLVRAEINIHFAYSLTFRSRTCPIMVFHVDDYVQATRALARHGFVLLGREDLEEGR